MKMCFPGFLLTIILPSSCFQQFLSVFISTLSYIFLFFTELLLHTLQLPVGHPDQPFSIRLLSFDDLLAAPIDCYCPVITVAAAGNGAGVDDNAHTENSVQQVVS